MRRYVTTCFLLSTLALGCWFAGNIRAQGDVAAQQALAASAQAAEATRPAASMPRTRANVLDGMDQSTEGMVGAASVALEHALQLAVDAAGGDATRTGRVMRSLFAWLSWEVAARPLWLYLLSLFVILLGLTLRHFVVRRVLNMLSTWASRTKTTLDDRVLEAVGGPLRLLVFLFALYVGVRILFIGYTGVDLEAPENRLTAATWHLFRSLVYLALLYAVGWGVSRLADVGVDVIKSFYARQGSELDITFVPLIRRTLKVFLWGVIILQALNYLHFDTVVNSLLAAAGVSGLAIGLAAQDTIKNFFGSIVLMADRPFSVGDWVVAGDTEGVVEGVGIRSTKIRTFAKTLVTVPNSSIVDRDINNFSRMFVRRVKMTVGVTYDTTAEQMEELLRRIRALLRDDPDVWDELMLVRFTDFGGSSLDIFMYYFTNTTVWDEYLAVRERINLRVMQILEDLGLEIAFPSRTVYLQQEDPK